MILNADNILLKTYRGYCIYAYVLHQYGKVDILKYFGREAPPVPNPFTRGSLSLIISLRNGMATHHDLEHKDFHGDAFDFAQLHFKCPTREHLYRLLNQQLQLGLENGSESLPEQGCGNPVPPASEARMSFFLPPVRNIYPSGSLSLVELRDLIAGPKYKEITRQLRLLKDPVARREYKARHFPYLTFSGCFSKRQEKALLQHSGLIAIDLDHLPYLEETRQLLLEDTQYEPEMVFVTPSGEGLKWILSFNPRLKSQKEFFQETAAYLQKRYRLQADPAARDIPRASFIPHDPKVYLRGEVEPR